MAVRPNTIPCVCRCITSLENKNRTMGANRMLHLEINASEVAKVIGANPFVDESDARRMVLRRHGVRFQDTTREEATRSQASFVMSLVSKDLKRAAAAAATGEEACKAVPPVERVHKVLGTGATLEQAEQVHREITSRVTQTVGTRLEAPNVATYEATRRVKVARRQLRVSRTLPTPGGNSYTLRGKLDGYSEAEGCVEEFKNRKRRLFGMIPGYELAQLYVYMALTDSAKARQIETFRDAQNVHHLDFDDDTWACLTGQLGEAVDRMYRVAAEAQKCAPAPKKLPPP